MQNKGLKLSLVVIVILAMVTFVFGCTKVNYATDMVENLEVITSESQVLAESIKEMKVEDEAWRNQNIDRLKNLKKACENILEIKNPPKGYEEVDAKFKEGANETIKGADLMIHVLSGLTKKSDLPNYMDQIKQASTAFANGGKHFTDASKLIESKFKK